MLTAKSRMNTTMDESILGCKCESTSNNVLYLDTVAYEAIELERLL